MRHSFSTSGANMCSMKWIGIGAKLGDDERHPLDHQPGDERHVTGQPAKLRDHDRSLARLAECS
jgi:hypothetical protein